MDQASLQALLDKIPLWGVFLLSLAFTLSAMELGFYLGVRRARLDDREKEAPVGATVGSTLGLLAFVLAFTFGLAAARFDSRREAFLDEVNSIRTSYLAAPFLPGERGTKLRELLRDYVDLRLEIVAPGADIPSLLKKSVEMQQQMWSVALESGFESPSSETVAFAITSVSDVIENHARRTNAGLRARIPPVIWGALYLIAGLSLVSVGYQIGLAKSTRTKAAYLMVVSFVVILLLIADLDRPQQGFINVGQAAMSELRAELSQVD